MSAGKRFELLTHQTGDVPNSSQELLDALANLIASKAAQIQSKPAREISFREFAALYIREHAQPHKRTWKMDAYCLDHYLIPEFGDKSMHEIRLHDVSAFHSKLSRIPYQANRLFEILRKMFNLASAWDYLPPNQKLPTKGIKKYPEMSRERFLSVREMERFSEAVDKLQSKELRCAFWLYLLTALRKSELLSLRWDNVDLEKREIKIPVTKNGQAFHQYLNEPACALLQSLERRGDFVFPGDSPETHRKYFERPWRIVRKNARLEDCRLHDLRRTAGSWLIQSGASLELVGKVLNHRSAASTRVYARFARKDVANALETYGKELNEFIKAPPYVGSGPELSSAVKQIESEPSPQPLQEPKSYRKSAKNSAVRIRGADQVIVESKILICLKAGGRVKRDFYKKIGDCFAVNSRELSRILLELEARGLIETYREESSWNVTRFRLLESGVRQ